MKTHYLKKTFGYEKFVAIGKTHELIITKWAIDKQEHSNIDWLLDYYKKNGMAECTKAEFDAFHIEVSTFLNQPLEEIEESAFDDSFIDGTREKIEEIKKDPILEDLFKTLGDIYGPKDNEILGI